MKKHELLKFAYDNYPKGTNFKSTNGIDYHSTGNFTCWQDHFNDASHEMSVWQINKLGRPQGMVYDGETKEWAEIVKQKIAVKVENEKEFKALMKYYDSLGWKSRSGKNPTSLVLMKDAMLFEYVSVGENFVFPNKDSDAASNTLNEYYEIFNSEFYNKIPFSDFAKEHNIKLPLITSEDGSDLYEGSKYYQAVLSFGKWELNIWKSGNPWTLEADDNVVLTPEENKAFSTKESAIKWIEEQKPKEVSISLYFGLKALINKDKGEVHILCDETFLARLSTGDIKDINYKLEELS